jgi:tetratricopeptide (TPR) repeat protein
MRNGDHTELARQAMRATSLLESSGAGGARRRLARMRPRLEAALRQAPASSVRLGLALGLDACLEQSPLREEHLELLDESARRMGDPSAAAHLSFRAARIEFLRGYRESALVRLERIAATAPDPLAAEVQLVRSAALRYLGQADHALTIADDTLRRETPAWIEMRARFHRAGALLMLERWDEFEGAARDALASTLPLRAARQRALVLTLLALHATAMDRPALAREYAAEAMRRFEAQGDRLMAGKALACLARARLERGDPLARRTLSRAQKHVETTGDRGTLTSLVLLHAEHVRENASARLQECLWDNEALGLEALAADVRGAVACFDPDVQHHLVVGPYRACLVEGRARTSIDLARHEKARRVLRRLAEARASGRGPLPVEALLVAAWPGERLIGTSGQNRVYATVRFLRRAGLESVLRSCSEGYELMCPVRLVP